MERCIGLDAHGTSCTFAVIGQGGKKLRQDVIETNGAVLRRSEWPHVQLPVLSFY